MHWVMTNWAGGEERKKKDGREREEKGGGKREGNQGREIGMLQLKVRNEWLIAVTSSCGEAKKACTQSQRKHGFLISDAWVLDLQPTELGKNTFLWSQAAWETWSEWGLSFTGSRIERFVSHVVAAWGGGRAQEEALLELCPTSAPPSCVWVKLWPSSFPLLLSCPPHHDGLPSSGLMRQNKLFLKSLLPVCFIATEKWQRQKLEAGKKSCHCKESDHVGFKRNKEDFRNEENFIPLD